MTVKFKHFLIFSEETMKKILALLLVVAMAAMMFVACGDAEVTTEPTVTTTEAAATTTAATTTAATTTAATTTAATTTAATTTAATTTAATTAATTTTAPVTPTDSYVVTPYAHITFKDGAIVDLMDVVELEIKTASGATAATVENTAVKFDGKTATVPALRIKNLGTWVMGTFLDVDNADDLNTMVDKNGGWSVEAFYMDNSSTNAARGIVCVTESVGGDGKRSGWGIAEDATGKPYFITGHVAENTYSSAYASSAASTQELVHVIGIYNAKTLKVEIYINGTLNASNVAAGAFTAADKTDKVYGFNMANTFCIGSDPSGSNKPNGDFPADNFTLVDAKLYDKALTATEVADIYAAVVANFGK